MYIYERNADYSMVPGHMTKTKRQIQSSLKLVDAVAEIIDARILSVVVTLTLQNLFRTSRELFFSINAIWLIKLLRKCGLTTLKSRILLLSVDCKSGRGLDKFAPAVNTVMSHKIARLKEKEW